MMLNYGKKWKVFGAFLFAAGMSVGITGTTQAGDECCPDETCIECCNPDSVFCNAGTKLSNRLKSLCGLWKNNGCCIDDTSTDDCTGDDCCEDSCIDIEESGWKFGGWAQIGYHNISNGMFNNNPNRLNAQQMWLYAEKKADGSDGWGFGGRFDIMYGTDANDSQAFGNSNSVWDFSQGNNIRGGYGWALPQAYVEAAYGDWSIIAGHFFTLLGYEVITAPDNFFYSHAMTMYNSEAFTHTGVLATHQTTDTLETYMGWTLGWDTGFDQNAGGSNFLGGFSKQLTDDTSLTYITTAGDLGWLGTGYSHSIVVDHQVNCKLNYVFQSDYVDATAYNPFGIAGAGTTEAYGINQYLIYTVNDMIATGARFEWWRAGGNNSYSLTGGVNLKLHDNFKVRPEVRYFFADPNLALLQNAAAGDNFNDSFVFGIDAILTF